MAILFWCATAFVLCMTLGMLRRHQYTKQTHLFSVVVVARNESELLPRCLQSLAALTHPDFEIVLVDDASTDDTFAIMEAWCAQAPNRRCLRLIEKDPDLPGKRTALNAGIRASKNPLIALTDADCAVPSDWLQSFEAGWGERTGIVTGIFESDHLPFFTRFKRLMSNGVLCATVGAGIPFTASGGNLCFSREAYLRVNGFSGMGYIPYGDDKMLLNRIRQAGYRVAFQGTARVTELPRTQVNHWRRNKRHFGKFGMSGMFHQALSLLLGVVFVAWPVALFMPSARVAAIAYTAGLYAFYFMAVSISRARVRIPDLLLLPLYPYFVAGMTVIGSLGRAKWR